MENKNNQSLSVRGLCKNYPSFSLRGLSFDLRPGLITGLIGRNGAGKTMAINAMLSMIRPDGGEIFYRGESVRGRENAFREKIGFVSAGMTYYTRKPLKTITAVTRSFYPRWDENTYQRMLRLFSITEDKTPDALSNGMKIKYALALALSHGAELFILDEPTSGLDPVSREELTEIFLELKDQGRTVLFSTHITSDLEKCADRILFLQNGRLTADESLNVFQKSFEIVETAGDVSPKLNALSRGVCRTRDGSTVLIDRSGSGFVGREATLEEIMVHLEKGLASPDGDPGAKEAEQS